MTLRFDLQSAFRAAHRHELPRWVGDFLASRGSDNATLAAGLAQRPHWWTGPLRVPIDRIERLAGPERDVECPIDPAEWEHDVDAMKRTLERGWAPPPLVLQHRDGHLLLQDGNHRFEALVREGESHAWAVIWFDDKTEFDHFKRGNA